MVQIADIATNLELQDDGIWYCRTKTPVSYPDQGSAVCFVLEDQSFWFRHRNDCIVEVVRQFPPAGPVLDIGGGTSEVAVISLNGIVYAASVRVGGDRFDEAIISYVRRNYGILIGEATAEKIKKEIGNAYPGQELLEIEIKGRNLSEGIPRSFSLNSNEILEALQEPLHGIVSSVKTALEQTPPELGADVAERGIVLTGGGALLKDLDRLLMEETGLPVVTAEDPLTCVARGGGRVLELIDKHGGDFLAVE